MLAVERRNQILEKLHEEKKVVVSELSQLYQVSEETIRRDLERLEKEGLAVKSYGGAVLNENTNIDLPFNVRKKHNVHGKQKIANLVADMINDGDHIMLDASSTAVFIAKALKSKKRLTVVTNSIEVLLELADAPDWNVITPGGVLREGFLALVGPKAVNGIASYNVEKTFVSCKAFDPDKGFSDTSEEFVQVKQTMLQAGKECILVVDSSKFYKLAFSTVGHLKDIDILITDKKPDDYVMGLCKEANVKVLYPQG